MSRLRSRLGVMAVAAVWIGCASPAAAKDLACDWKALGSFSLNFGSIDPSNPVPFPLTRPITTVTTNANLVGDCNTGATMVVEIVGGNSRTMTNGAGSTIAYTISGFPLTLPRPGNNQYTDFIAAGAPSGTITYGAAANARAGVYTDTVRISVTP